MPGNSFGHQFRITTFGESHGPAVGVVIDGVPAGIPISQEDIAFELSFRRPGRQFVSGRREKDNPEILSGIFNGRTTGSPIAIVVRNEDVISSLYEDIKYKPRPGHADITFIRRYGLENWDYRGGGRSSARETVGRVAAGAVAKKLIMIKESVVAGYLESLGDLHSPERVTFEQALCSKYSPVRAPDGETEKRFEEIVSKVFQEGDSVGGVAEVIVRSVPAGLGEPVFDKIKADLAKAALSIPAVIGFEYGYGFKMARGRGSEMNDSLVNESGKVRFERNTSGGILGGITTGEDIIVRAAFKPTSSIRKPIKTVDLRTGEEATISVKGRHDPAVAIRGVSVLESMVAIVLADHMLRSGVINPVRIEKNEAEQLEKRWDAYKRACLQGHTQGSQ